MRFYHRQTEVIHIRNCDLQIKYLMTPHKGIKRNPETLLNLWLLAQSLAKLS